MPNAYILNQRPMGNGPAISNLVEMLVSAGWTYQASGSGASGIFSPAPTTVTISNASPGIVSWTTHGLAPLVPVVFTTTGSLPAEIVSGTTYYITAANFTANSFSVSAAPGGAAINTSSASTATTTGTVKKVFTSAVAPTPVLISNSSPATVYWPAHGLLAGTTIRLTTSSGLPSGLSTSTTYFIISTGLATDTFRLSATAEGTAINTTTIGTGIHTATVLTSWGNSASTTDNAWARVQDPSGVREFLFQIDNNASGAGGKVRYSAASKFTGTSNGAVSATIPPTATDERYLRGSSGSFGALWFPLAIVNNAATMQGAAMSTAPYGWWYAIQAKGGGARYSGMLFDPVTSVAEDPDPYVIHIGAFSGAINEAFSVNTSSMGRDGSQTTTWTTACGGTTTGSFAFMDVGKTSFLYVQPMGYVCTSGGGAAFGIIQGASGNTTAALNPGYLGPNPFNSKPDAMPVPWFRVGVVNGTIGTNSSSSTMAPGIKGWSTMLRWTTENRSSFVDTLNSKAWICVGAFWLPWDGVTTPIN